MRRYRSLFLVLGLFLLIGGFVIADKAATTPIPAYLINAVKMPVRQHYMVDRDARLKPAEVLNFAGVKPGQKVALLLPDRYWMSIVSMAVGYTGHVYGMEPMHGIQRNGTINSMTADAPKRKAAGKPYIPAYVSYMDLQPLQHTKVFRNFQWITSNQHEYGFIFPTPEDVDVVFTAQRYHELHNKFDGVAVNDPFDMVKQNNAIFRNMKPGGIYVISDFAAAKGDGFSHSQDLNRVEKAAVIEEVKAAGFEYVGESNLLANANDDHTQPAFDTTPFYCVGVINTGCDPTKRPNGDKADQFILKFRKPLNASMAKNKRVSGNFKSRFIGNVRANGTPELRGNSFYFFNDPTGAAVEIMLSLNDNPEYEYVYFDADGDYCNYHEIPQDGVAFCYQAPPEFFTAKLGTCFRIHGGNDDTCLLKGQLYPNSAEVAPVAPGKQPNKQPRKGNAEGGSGGGGEPNGI